VAKHPGTPRQRRAGCPIGRRNEKPASPSVKAAGQGGALGRIRTWNLLLRRAPETITGARVVVVCRVSRYGVVRRCRAGLSCRAPAPAVWLWCLGWCVGPAGPAWSVRCLDWWTCPRVALNGRLPIEIFYELVAKNARRHGGLKPPCRNSPLLSAFHRSCYRLKVPASDWPRSHRCASLSSARHW
jgi:hypothetical protein